MTLKTLEKPIPIGKTNQPNRQKKPHQHDAYKLLFSAFPQSIAAYIENAKTDFIENYCHRTHNNKIDTNEIKNQLNQLVDFHCRELLANHRCQ